jgi:hypothetical protein
MITFLILTQLVLPLAAIAWFAIAPQQNVLGFWLQALVTAILLFAIARAAVWLFPPWWMSYVYRIAEVGNSGASDEPHLHIHAQRAGSSGAAFSGDPLPIRLNGRYLIRGDRLAKASI